MMSVGRFNGETGPHSSMRAIEAYPVIVANFSETPLSGTSYIIGVFEHWYRDACSEWFDRDSQIACWSVTGGVTCQSRCWRRRAVAAMGSRDSLAAGLPFVL